MEIETIAEHQLNPQDEAAINALLTAAFKEDFGDRSFHQQRHHFRLIMRDGVGIIGHMALCYRSVRLGAALVRVMGLGDVATHPDHQGKGIASGLLTASIDIAKGSEADFYLLFGVRPIYAGHGFRAVPNPIIHVEMYHARTCKVSSRDSSDLMVMELRDQKWDDVPPVDLLGHMF